MKVLCYEQSLFDLLKELLSREKIQAPHSTTVLSRLSFSMSA